jgi:guanine deaminase
MSAAERRKKLFLGTFVHSKTQTELEIVENSVIGVDEKGIIRFIDTNVKVFTDSDKHGWEDAQIIRVPQGAWLFPGFIGKLMQMSFSS